MSKLQVALLVVVGIVLAARTTSAQHVVAEGHFTNIYVVPDPDNEGWDAHFKTVDSARAAEFTRAKIDKFTDELMAPTWPSYFDSLLQYGIHPPRFYGSALASAACVKAALKDRKNGVIPWDAIRALANCHKDGLDPSTQVNLIFSPDLKVARFSKTEDMCTKASDVRAYHSGFFNVPDFAVISTASGCAEKFSTLTQLMSHEIVEILTDPKLLGHGGLGGEELADKCHVRSSIADKNQFLEYRGFEVERYFSDFDQRCEPNSQPPPGDRALTWIMGTGSPLKRFTGSVHELTLDVPTPRSSTDAVLDVVRIYVQTGGDDLRAGNNPNDNAQMKLRFRKAGKATVGPASSLNGTSSWHNGTTHMVVFNRAELPKDLKVNDILGVTITTNFGGSFDGDNWNVDKVALQVTFAEASNVTVVPEPIVHEWADASAAPLVRFAGDRHELSVPLSIPNDDLDKEITALELIISTGNDDLRGGSNASDNANVEVRLTRGSKQKAIGNITNVNGGRTWPGWDNHTVSIPIGKGFKGKDLDMVILNTHFGGGLSGDNWNVNRVQLRATLK